MSKHVFASIDAASIDDMFRYSIATIDDMLSCLSYTV